MVGRKRRAEAKANFTRQLCESRSTLSLKKPKTELVIAAKSVNLAERLTRSYKQILSNRVLHPFVNSVTVCLRESASTTLT